MRNGRSPPATSVNHIGVPPGARVEFVVTGPPAGVPGLFVTRTVDTGRGGENDPNRALSVDRRRGGCARAAIEVARILHTTAAPKLRGWAMSVPVRVRAPLFLGEAPKSKGSQQRDHFLASPRTARRPRRSIRESDGA